MSEREPKALNGSPEENVGNAFRHTLNYHGHSFQRRVWRAFGDLRVGEQGNWRREAYGYPVSLLGHSTDIDMIVRAQGKPLFLVIECKRTDPALSWWCFARGKSDEKRADYHLITKEGMAWQSTGYSSRVFGIGLDVKTGKKGDGSSPGRGAIEMATTQVLRGVAGLIEQLGQQRGLLMRLWYDRAGRSVPEHPTVILLPVIVTTATLWASEVDVESADLISGELAEGQVQVVQDSEGRWA